MSLKQEPEKKSEEQQLGDLNAALIHTSVASTDTINMNVLAAMFQASLGPIGDLLTKNEAVLKPESGARPRRRRSHRRRAG